MANTPNTGIPYVTENTQDPAAGLNLALNVIDALLQTAVIDMDQTAPPGIPSDGDLHIVASGATGDWAGQDNNLARYVAEGAFWQFYEAGSKIKLVLNFDDSGLYKWDGSGWSLAAGLGDAPSDGTGYVRKDGGWAAESGGGGSSVAQVVTESGASLTADDTNAGNYTRFTSSSAKTYTFDDSETYTVNDEYHGRNVGAGDLTLIEGGTMTLNPPAGGTLVIPQGGTFTVKIVASDEADVFGVTVAA